MRQALRQSKIMKTSRELTCADCGILLDSGETAGASSPSQACPRCGSANQHLHMGIEEGVPATVRDRLEAELKDDSYPSRKKTRQEIIYGFDERKSKGDLAYKERVIDRDTDTYREYVAEYTGAVIRDVSQKLSEHRGHGSAKFKKDPPAPQADAPEPNEDP